MHLNEEQPEVLPVDADGGVLAGSDESIQILRVHHCQHIAVMERHLLPNPAAMRGIFSRHQEIGRGEGGELGGGGVVRFGHADMQNDKGAICTHQ